MSTRVVQTIDANATGFIAALKDAERHMKMFQANAETLALPFTKLQGVVSAVLGSAVIGFLKQAVTAIDDLDEAAQNIGSTAVALSEMRIAAQQGGVSADELQAALTRLNVKATEAAGGSKEAQAVFRAMGVTVRDANGNLKPTEVLLGEISDRFSSYSAGAEKSALAVELFGKAGARLIAYLNQGSEGLRVASGLTEEYVKQAIQAQKEIDKVSASWERFKNVVGGELAARINETIAVMDRLGGMGPAVARVLKEMVISPIAGLLAFQSRLQRAREELREFNAAAEESRRLANSPLANMNTRERERAPVVRKEELQKEADAYGPLRQQMQERIALLNAEMNQGEKLSEVEKFIIKTKADMESGYLKLSAAQKAAVTNYLGEIAALEMERQELDAFDKASKQFLETREKIRGNVSKLLDQYYDEAEAAGLTGEALRQFRLERELDRAGLDRNTEAYKNYLQQLTEFDKLREAREANQKYWNGVEGAAREAWNNAIFDSENAMKRLRETLKRGLADLLFDATFKSLLDNLRKALNVTSTTDGGSSFFGGLFRSLFGGGGTGTGSGGVGGGSLTGGTVQAASLPASARAARANSAMTYAPTYYIDSRSDRSEIVALIENNGGKTKSDIYESMRRGGAFAAAARG